MPSYIGIGFSKNLDSLEAAKEAVEESRHQLGEGRIDLAIVYHTIHYQPKDFLSYLHTALDKTRLVGSSTAALILSRGVEDRGIAVLTVRSDRIKFEIGHVGHLHYQDIFTAGKQMAAECVTEFGAQFRKFLIFYANGLNPYLPQLIDGLKDQMGQAFPIYGAGSSDAFTFKKTNQIYNDQPLTDGAVGIILGGTMQTGISIKHGWLPLGKPRTVTAITEGERHVINTIDRKDAVSLYREFFGPEADDLGLYRLGLLNVRYPLGLFDEGRQEYILRNVTNTLDDGSIVCQDKVAKDVRAHIMLGGKESCLRATQEAATEVKKQLSQKKPEFILVFESMMRYRLLRRALKEELAIIKKTFGDDAPVFGMFSTNEVFTPRYFVQENVPTGIHNGCMLMMAIC